MSTALVLYCAACDAHRYRDAGAYRDAGLQHCGECGGVLIVLVQEAA